MLVSTGSQTIPDTRLAPLPLRGCAAAKDNYKLQEPLAPSISAELLSSNLPVISVLQGSQTQPAIEVPPVATHPSATSSSRLHLNDCVAPESRYVMLTS